MNIDKKWTFLDHLPTSDLVLSTQFVNDSLRKVLLKFHRKTMGFCTWGNEVPSERGRICQNCRDWFAISRKLVQTFFRWISFFYGNHVIFLFPFWPLIKVYFLFSCKCFVMSFFEESWWWWAYLFVILFMVFLLPWELGNKKI